MRGEKNYRDLWLILRLCKVVAGFKGWRSWQWNQSRGLKVATRSGPMCQFITVLATPDGWGNQSVTLYTKTLLICNILIINLSIVCLFDLVFRQWIQSRGLKVATRWNGPMCQFITVLTTPDGWGNQSVTLYTKTLLICNIFLINFCLFIWSGV